MSVLTHQQEGVSWRSMVQSAASEVALGHSPLPTNPIAAEVFKQGEQVVASTMVGQALSRQKLDASSVAANVFGSMLGGAAAGSAAVAAARYSRYSGVAGEAAGSQRAGIASGHSPVAGSGGVIHPTTERSPLSHSTTGTPVQENWSGDDWRSDFKEANHDAYFAPAYYEIPRQGSSRESVLMQGVNAVNAFGDAFSSGARGMVHELARHPVQSTVNVLKGLASLGEAAYDLGNEISHLAGLPASTAAIARNHAREIGVVNAYHAESRAFRTGTAVQRAAMLGSAALFVAESLGAGGTISSAGRLAFSASRLGRVGLFAQPAIDPRVIAAAHVREARNLLKEIGLDATERNQILYSFDLETFRVERASESREAFRFFDDSEAKLQGRYASPDFLGNQTSRIVQYALPNNSATRLAIVGIPEKAVMFTGKIASQAEMIPGLIGGQRQIFLLGRLDDYTFTEVPMPREDLVRRSSFYGY